MEDLLFKPAIRWALLCCSYLLLLAALIWGSLFMLKVEQNDLQQEAARLSLWRMESFLNSFLQREGSQSYSHYNAFYSVDGAYSSLYTKVSVGSILHPSPLLTNPSPYSKLHFAIEANGNVKSPQIPEGNLLDLVESVGSCQADVTDSTNAVQSLAAKIDFTKLRSDFLLTQPKPAAVSPNAIPSKIVLPQTNDAPSISNEAEFNARLTQQEAQSYNNNFLASNTNPSQFNGGISTTGPVVVGSLKPFRSPDELFLLRVVSQDDALEVQGLCIHQDKLVSDLLQEIQDLLPDADLIPIAIEPSSKNASALTNADNHRLAGMPFELKILSDLEGRWDSPTRISLGIVWLAVILAALALTKVFRSLAQSAEKRRSFVSAVTHELRTPLTTFQIYTDMLCSGMLETKEKQNEYLERLRLESNRLTHLVNNVLTYSRLESSTSSSDRSPIKTEELADRLGQQSSLLCHEAHAKINFDFSAIDQCTKQSLVDQAALEQIILNLIDNACKYAKSTDSQEAQEIKIKIYAEIRDPHLRICVEDNGPGVQRANAQKIFRAFHKSDQEAAHSAPGVGLGLALCKRLAKQNGGQLLLENKSDQQAGARFVIQLPLI